MRFVLRTTVGSVLCAQVRYEVVENVLGIATNVLASFIVGACDADLVIVVTKVSYFRAR